MKRNRKAAWLTHSLPGLGSHLMVALFFVLAFLYSWLRIEPGLRYHYSAPVFFLDSAFFRGFLGYPGGPAEYLAAFLAQLDYFNWLGALVLSGLGGLLFVTTRSLLRRTRGRSALVVALGPPFLLLLLQNAYGWPVWWLGTGLLLALGLGAAYVSQPWTCPWLRLIGGWIAAALVFYLAGLWPCLLLVTLCGVFEFVGQRRWSLGIGSLSSALVIPLLKLGFSNGGSARVFKLPGEGWFLGATVVFFLFVPGAMMLLSLLTKYAVRTEEPASGRKAGGRASRFQWVGQVSSVGLFLLGGLLVWRTFDHQRQELIRIGYYTDQKQWSKVLTVGSRLEQVDVTSEINIVRALYHTGRLADDLFSFSIPVGFDLLPGFEGGLESCRAQSETLLELGQVNMAEHFAHEALESDGERPEILQLLARINVLKGRPKAARVFLNVLQKIPFHRGAAEEGLRRLERGGNSPENRELTEIRLRMVATDQPSGILQTGALLAQLLNSNPRNRMAFEYLMVHWLLTLQLENVVAGLGLLTEFDYTGIPRHYEEALLLQQRLQGSSSVELTGRTIRPETRRRFAQFLERISRGEMNTLEGRQALLQDFGDTYWLYHLSRGAGQKPAATTGAKS